MHELGITQGIIDRAREAAQRSGAVRVTDLYISLTAAADFTQESIEMYFEMLTQDDELFRGAVLHFALQPVDATCLKCGRQFAALEQHPSCLVCGSFQVRFDPRAPMLQLTDIGVDEAGDGE